MEDLDISTTPYSRRCTPTSSAIVFSLSWSLVFTFLLTMKFGAVKEFYYIRQLSRSATWASNLAIESHGLVVLGSEQQPTLCRISDLKPIFRFPEPIESLQIAQLKSGEKLLVGYRGRWTLLSLPGLETEWTIKHLTAVSRVIVNDEWLIEIIPDTPPKIDNDLSLTLVAWRWPILDPNTQDAFPEPDVTRAFRLKNVSSGCEIYFPNECSDLALRNDHQTVQVHLATPGVEVVEEDQFSKPANYRPEPLFDKYNHIAMQGVTNLKRGHTTGSATVTIMAEDLRPGLAAIASAQFNTSSHYATVRAGRVALPNEVHVWYCIIVPTLFWVAFSIFDDRVVQRLETLSRRPSLWLGLWGAAGFLLIVLVFEPLLLNIRGEWKYPIAIWLLPAAVLLALFCVTPNDRFAESLKQIFATCFVMVACLAIASITGVFLASPALSQYGKSMFPVVACVVYSRLARRSTAEPKRLVVTSRWIKSVNQLLRVALFVQLLMAVLTMAWWVFVTLPLPGNYGLLVSLFFFLALHLGAYATVIVTIVWMVAWWIQAWNSEFYINKTLIAFSSIVPSLVNLLWI